MCCYATKWEMLRKRSNKAIKKGNDGGMRLYGTWLCTGQGIPKEEEKGIRYIISEAESITEYSTMLLHGEGVPV